MTSVDTGQFRNSHDSGGGGGQRSSSQGQINRLEYILYIIYLCIQ